MEIGASRKRSRSCSPPWGNSGKLPRPASHARIPHSNEDETKERKQQESFVREQTRRNQIQEAEQMREWVSKEDDFVLKQSKKKAQIRVREGRAKPIDWLAVILNVIDPTKDLLEDDLVDSELEIMDPEGVVEDLASNELRNLEKEIDLYMVLEVDQSNCLYWNAMKTICRDRQNRMTFGGPSGNITSAVSTEVDQLLSPKSLEQLSHLDVQISRKLQSNEPIDVEYWEQILRGISVYKAKAELKTIYRSIIDSRLQGLKEQQMAEAELVQEKLEILFQDKESTNVNDSQAQSNNSQPKSAAPSIAYSKRIDPEPMLKIRAEDKGMDIVDEFDFVKKIDLERRKVLKMGYVPMRQRKQEKSISTGASKLQEVAAPAASRFAAMANEDFSSATKALYEREVARGVQEDEEIFAGEEEVSTLSKPQWAGKYRPRKPRYFNRVQMGYEWNKYNQTHYDHDNPPPKVVQGYKFNIFYPDLIDKVRAPTYRIERENGRKRGQSFAPAGEEDTCLIRFTSGPPYEDLAFRIIDKEWDYSAKRERGFRSSFDKGILQLHFQFKKVYYRK